MKKSESDQSFYIDSDEEIDDKKVVNEDDYDTDYSEDNNQQDKPSSYTTAWPQSYRQSIDLYSSVPSPSIGFLGTPTLSRLGSSFLASSLTRRHTPESLAAVTKPLLPPFADEHVPEKRRSSASLLPPLPQRKSSIRKDEVSYISHEGPISRQSTFGQAVVNGVNVLCGVGLLSTPYAAKEGGWAGLSILIIFGILSFYTGMLLRYCLDSEPGLETYPDIGQAAFGTTGRIVISASCVEYIILEGDNLSSLFPNAHLNIGPFELSSHNLFALLVTLAVLPTVWLRDLSVLSYISAGGVIATVMVVLCLFWVGVIDHVGTYSRGSALNLSTLPVAIGMYGFCYSGHAVFPNIYTSMAKPNQFPLVLLTCFGICTLLYAGVAIMGYAMFGENTQTQFTLNMPQDLVASKIALWTTELIPLKSHTYAVGIRTALVISTLLVSLTIPFFGLVMSLMGSLLTMLISFIVPCACYLSILRGKLSRLQFLALVPMVGWNLYLDYCGWSCIIGDWNSLGNLQNHREINQLKLSDFKISTVYNIIRAYTSPFAQAYHPRDSPGSLGKNEEKVGIDDVATRNNCILSNSMKKISESEESL
ncbi:hypothetical protein ACFE04_009347 [Oxalis oulophora]